MHAGIVILNPGFLHREPLICFFEGSAVFKHNHARHHGRRRQVGYIIGLNIQRRLIQTQQTAQLLQGKQLLCGTVAAQGNGFRRIMLCHLEAFICISPLSDFQMHRMSGLLCQKPGDQSLFRDSLFQQHIPGNIRSVPVKLGHEFLQQLHRIFRIVKSKGCLVRQSPSPVHQDGYCRFLPAGGCRNQVAVRQIRVNDLLGIPCFPDCLDPVTQLGCPLELQLLCRLLHLGGKPLDGLLAAGADIRHSFFNQCSIGFLVHIAPAKSHAFVNMIIETGTLLPEILGKPPATGRKPEYLVHLVHSLPGNKGTGIGAKVGTVLPGVLLFCRDPGIGRVGNLDIKIPLVILQ